MWAKDKVRGQLRSMWGNILIDLIYHARYIDS